jgi:hypothetical protein
MDWESIKEQSWIVFARGAQLLVFLQVISYLVACGIAEKPIGPKAYVKFAYHCIQWNGGREPVTPAVYARER